MAPFIQSVQALAILILAAGWLVFVLRGPRRSDQPSLASARRAAAGWLRKPGVSPAVAGLFALIHTLVYPDEHVTKPRRGKER